MRFKKRADERFHSRVWDGTYTNGKKHYKDLYADSQKELEEKVIQFNMSVKTGTIKSDVDLYQYCLSWLENSKSYKEETTKLMYFKLIRAYFQEFKGKSFDYYCYEVIQSMINDNKDHPRTCQLIRLTLKQIGKSAELDKYLPKGTTEEIFARVQVPKYKAKEKRVLTDAELQALLKADMPIRTKAFVYTLYFTGVRKEEALALHKSDIQGNMLSITKAIGYLDSTPILKGTKSERGNRKIPIPKALSEVYEEYFKTIDGDILFAGKDGGYMRKPEYATILRHMRACVGQDVNAHLFRHNYCTKLCYQSLTNHSISTKKIAELLGDSEQMVLSVYSHIVEEKEKTIENIEEALKL